ncbi:MAG: UDP-N-acetylmuramoyl-tripeptide--D-alanyl-D-alanine ligase [Actinomycetia bacterium]|nr:UDP-N-acetylmuramoyl-tripeptide--D-alanyl-D-alanine ligase [Actinomycetes bacterium]
MSAKRSALGWSLRDVEQATGGVLIGNTTPTIEQVVIDSRTAVAGSLFVAIQGDNFDGHDFASAALEAGAVGLVVEQNRCSGTTPRIEVDDTRQALRDLAVMRRNELAMPVVAITGSTGKTSTKDLIASGIEGSWASPRSYNNEIGVPLTVLATPDDATVLILEVGSRGTGHIRWLSSAIQPDISVITNLGVVHLETFGDEEGLADAKYELIEALSETGVAVLPAHEARLSRNPTRTTVTFGDAPASVEVASATVDGDGSAHYVLKIDGETFEGSLSMAGAHQVANLAAGAAVARALDVPMSEFLCGAASGSGSEWRMDIHIGRYTIVNDAYNANPQSVEGALRTVASMDGRSIAVLGPMAELGKVCQSAHERMGALASDLDFSALLVVGPDHGYGLGAPNLVEHVIDIGAARDTLATLMEPGDVVLVKASRSAGLERLALTLIKEAAQ